MTDFTKYREDRARNALRNLGYVLRKHGGMFMIADLEHGGTVHTHDALGWPYALYLIDVEDWVIQLQA